MKTDGTPLNNEKYKTITFFRSEIKEFGIFALEDYKWGYVRFSDGVQVNTEWFSHEMDVVNFLLKEKV